MSAVAGRLAVAYSKTNAKVGVKLIAGAGLFPDARDSLRRFTGLLMGASGVVLLIACANMASLLLARSTARQKEIGVRLALGAGRTRIVRQLLTESALLACASGAGGILIAVWLNKLLRAALPEKYLAIPLELDLSPDVRVMGFTLAASLLTGVLFGLMPALQASKLDLTPMLKEEGATGRGGSAKLRRVLVGAQIALSMTLLVAAGLCVRSLRNVRAIAPGFETEHVLTAKLDLGRQNYTPEQGQIFYQQLVERVQALPGVQRASLALGVPFTGGGYGTGIRQEGQPKEGGARLSVSYSVITPLYFETVGIPLLLGRQFTERDSAGAPDVAVINETAARRMWPNESPLGRRFVFQGGKTERVMEVVGVIKDVKFRSLFEESRAFVYLPLAQFYMSQDMALHVRTAGLPETLAEAIKREASALDKNLPVYEIRTLAAQLDNALTPQRLAAMLVSGFGLLALILASMGLYGVMAYSVAQRTQEIGIRMALGAESLDVLKLIARQGMTLALIGVGAGLLASVALTRLMKSLLFGVSPNDPLTFAVIALLLTIVTLLACFIPARRATKIDPIIALRRQ